MPDPWQLDPEKKIWSKGAPEENKDQKLRKILTQVCEQNRVGTMIVMYVNRDDARNGKMMIIGQPSAKWLDVAWQRLRLFASDLISSGKVK